MSDIVERMVALANSLGGDDEDTIMMGVAEIERLRAFEDELMDTNRGLRVKIRRLRAERDDYRGVADDLKAFCDIRDRDIERLRAENEALRALVRGAPVG